MSIEELLETMRQENAAAHAETRAYIDTRLAVTDARIDASDSKFDALDGKFERLADLVSERTEHIIPRIDLLAEGLGHLNDKIDREAADVRGEMRRGFAETQAMFKYAHTDLDRRVRTLEEKQ